MSKKFDPGGQKESKEKLAKVLIADDDENLRTAVSALVQIIGYETETVEDGQALLGRILSGEKFDFILTDNNMPKLNGVEVLERIREDSRFENLPFIVQSGAFTDMTKARVLKRKGVWVEKPYSFDELEQKIKEAKAIVGV